MESPAVAARPSARADRTFSHGARDRLTVHDLGRFAGSTLFDRLGRVVCGVGKLPRKEFYEAWEVARRVRRWCRGGRIVDVAGGHGLLAHAMLLLDDSSPRRSSSIPRSHSARPLCMMRSSRNGRVCEGVCVMSPTTSRSFGSRRRICWSRATHAVR
jgi:hypothetical protein